MQQLEHLVIFDGECNFCNKTVDFVFKHNDRKNIFFASYQSVFAQSILPKEILEKEAYDTIYYYHKGKFYEKSTAVLQLCKELNSGYKLLAGLLIVPRFIRDAVYGIISKNRHLILGRSSTCRIPTEDEKAFFLERKEDIKMMPSY